jgi:hypothetical protein
MTVGDPLARISLEELERLQELGQRVSELLGRTGLPVEYQPDPSRFTSNDPGVHIEVDDLAPGVVSMKWRSKPASESLANAALDRGDVNHPDLRVNARAALAIGEAIVQILKEAGYEAGMGVDMDSGSVWVRATGSPH